MKTRLFNVALMCLLVAGCSTEKEKYRIMDSGVERGVAIDVVLVDGGTARLICPKFNGRPLGSHGRECYLDSYDYGN